MYRRGKKGYWQISVEGVRQSSRTADKERAKILEHKLNNEAWDAARGLTIPSWDQACLKWLRDHPKLAGKSKYKKMARWWLPLLTGKTLSALTPEFVHKRVSENRTVSLESRIKQNATANLYVSFVRRVIRHGSNLKPELQVYPPMLGSERWATVDEWHRVAKLLPPDALDVLTFAVVTGQREANVMFFEWKWDHGTWGTVPAADTKTSVPYGIPFNLTAQAIMERRRQSPVKHVRYVFSNAGKPWYRNALLRALKRACGEAGVAVLTVHALRHTFATWLARAGVAREIRTRLMAHSQASVHDRYIHHDVESLRAHSEVIDVLLADIKSAQAA